MRIPLALAHFHFKADGKAQLRLFPTFFFSLDLDLERDRFLSRLRLRLRRFSSTILIIFMCSNKSENKKNICGRVLGSRYLTGNIASIYPNI